MFQLLLHPIVDLRPLLPDVDVRRVARPLWPTPTPRRDFVRSSGAVQPRLQGGDDDWPGEDTFADARQATRFPNLLGSQVLGTGALASSARRVLRRFYSSGVVSRYETAFAITRLDASPLDAGDTARWIAGTTTVPVRRRGQQASLPLLKIGPVLAAHYLAATTSRKAPGPSQPWWVASGEPALVVEYRVSDGISPPPHARVVPSARVGAEVLHHAWLDIAGQRLSTWTLRNDISGTNPDELRKLRIHLVRLHTERECLRLVLEAATGKRLAGTVPQADALDDYLKTTLPLLTQPVKYGVEQSQLLEVARSALVFSLPGQSASFSALGKQVAANVERYIRRSEIAAPVVTQILGNQMNTHIQMGNVTVSGDFNMVTAHNIQNSFNKAAGADVQAPLKDALKTLATQVAELAKQLPKEKAEALSKDLATLTSEAVSAQPRKAWYELSADGLLEAAKTVASMSGPITTAVKAVLGLLA